MEYPKVKQALKNLDIWFKQHHRKLPFRENPSPYTTWISEIMSQQTTIQAVVPYFEKFILKYPTVFDLAQASEQDILTLWSGLGYYSRARNLHKTAQIIVQDYHGVFPEHKQLLLKLPGIGEYTAGAILSISLNKPIALVDTNVKRVLSRLRANTLSNNRLWLLAQQLVELSNKPSISSPRIFNQALMEIGATTCTSKQALCSECSLNIICKSYHDKLNPLLFPQLAIKKPKIDLYEEMILFNHQEQILIEITEKKWTKGLGDLPENIYHLVSGHHFSINYTITNHIINRKIIIINLIDLTFLPLSLDLKKYQWINLMTLDIKNPHFPMSSALKKSLLAYHQYKNMDSLFKKIET